MDLIEKTIESNKIFVGNIINVYLDNILLPNKKQARREVVTHPGGVCIAALNCKKELYFVEQYRYPKKEIVLELPAGKLEKNLSILENAKKELKEEVGVIGENYIYLGKAYASPGISNEDIHMYFCKVKNLTEPTPDEGEILKPTLINIDKAVNMILNNEIYDAKTQIAVLKTYMLLNKNL